MTVNELRKDLGLSYEKFARVLDITINTSIKMCKANGCVKMVVAQKVIELSRGRIGWEDLVLEGDC